MSDKFKAVVINQSGEKFTREIKVLDKNFFKSGDVLVKVEYSGYGSIKEQSIVKGHRFKEGETIQLFLS